MSNVNTPADASTSYCRIADPRASRIHSYRTQSYTALTYTSLFHASQSVSPASSSLAHSTNNPPTTKEIARIRRRRTRTLDLSNPPPVLPRSSSVYTKALRTTSSSYRSAPSSSKRLSVRFLPVSQSMPRALDTIPQEPTTQQDNAAQDSTPKAVGPSRFIPLPYISSSSPSSTNSITPTMQTKSLPKRRSMVGSVSVADRARQFQNASTDTVAAPTRPAKSVSRNDPSSLVAEATSSSSSASSTPSPSNISCSSSSVETVEEHVATIKTARRISIATPVHRRACSDASMLDPYLGQGADVNKVSRELTNPPTIRTSSIAELDKLTAKLELNRPRSKTLALPNRNRVSTVLMRSIAEETKQPRHCWSSETIRALEPVSSSFKDTHANFQVSPCLSQDGSIDWHHFVSANYGGIGQIDLRQPISITDLAFPISTRKRVYQSKLAKPDNSPTLNDEATWLEEELARCSSDEDEDAYNVYGTVRDSMDEEFSTPDGSPLLSPVNVMAPPPVEIMGLGIQDSSLLLPGGHKEAEKSADSLLEQVAMHEACLQTLHNLGNDERDQASAAAIAANDRHLTVPTLRSTASNGDFTSTHPDNADLFSEDADDASLSPMADLGHMAPAGVEKAGVRRASAASYLSTDSTASIGSHGSSLLFNSHLTAPGMERAYSADTGLSTRPSSIASSMMSHERAAPHKPPRSPWRINQLPLPPLPQEASAASARMSAMPLPPLPHEVAARARRQASRRQEGTEQPQLPARLDSLDAAVAAAPRAMQIKEEFPNRLLGDWVEQQHNASAFSVKPVPLHKRIRRQDGTTYLPGLGEIVPPSPDMGSSTSSASASAAARKRLGLDSTPTPKSPVAAASLKFKLSGRLGKSSESSVLGRMRKSSSKAGESDCTRISSAAALAAAELPAAWNDKIKRPSLDIARRPSIASLTSSASTHSSTLLPTERSRSSLGLRKMLNTITGAEQISQTMTVEALAAATFESRSSGRKRFESFIELSDEEDEEEEEEEEEEKEVRRRGNGRKDLTKMFGASHADLSIRQHSQREEGWTKSLGRSSTTKIRRPAAALRV